MRLTKRRMTDTDDRASDREPGSIDRDTDALIEASGQRRKGSSYHEVEFRVISPHSDGPNARSASFSFAAPPKYKRIIELLYSHPLTPWKTESDVLRAFVDYGAHYFGAALGGDIVTGILHSLDMMNRLTDQARETNDFVASIDQVDREVQRLVDSGMRESAVGLVYGYRDQAKRMPDKILRRKVVRDINQRFAYLLTGSQGRKEHEKPSAGVTDVDPDADTDESED
jgi:hypothetical protein